MAGTPAAVDAARAVAELRELQELTGDAHGAQRLAWTAPWRAAREWLRARLAEIDGVVVAGDEAGNLWATLPGESPRSVVLGGHLDSVADGGWLDGALNVVAALEVLRALAAGARPAATVRLVDWADEEGARFGRSIFGSSMCAGALRPDDVRGLTDRDGIRLVDALAEHGVDLDRMPDAQTQLRDVAAYLELHIEQGPVLEHLGLPLGAVLGTFGVERHRIRFDGAHAHAGTTPMDRRRDAFVAAARSAVAFRDAAARTDDTRATTGTVSVAPGIVTAFNGSCELSLDQRALDRPVLDGLLAEARDASARIAAEEGCTVRWEPLATIDPMPFAPELVDLAADVVQDLTGASPRLPSGALHDASAMAGVVPTAMLFVRSIGGVSHSNLEDTSVADLELSVHALHALTLRTVGWVQVGCGKRRRGERSRAR